MNTNPDILDQYALSLHGTASKILEKTIGSSPYPMEAHKQWWQFMTFGFILFERYPGLFCGTGSQGGSSLFFGRFSSVWRLP